MFRRVIVRLRDSSTSSLDSVQSGLSRSVPAPKRRRFRRTLASLSLSDGAFEGRRVGCFRRTDVPAQMARMYATTRAA